MLIRGEIAQIFSKLGLKAGDLVTAINGTPLDDPQRSQDVFNTIQTSDHVTVTIERGGQRQDITLNIAQVAAQATKELEGEPNGTGRRARQRQRRRRPIRRQIPPMKIQTNSAEGGRSRSICE